MADMVERELQRRELRENLRRLKRIEQFFYFVFVSSAGLSAFLASHRQHLLFYFAFTISLVYPILMYKFAAFRNWFTKPYWLHSLVLFLNIVIYTMSFEYYVAGCVLLTIGGVLTLLVALYKVVFSETNFLRDDDHGNENGFRRAFQLVIGLLGMGVAGIVSSLTVC